MNEDRNVNSKMVDELEVLQNEFCPLIDSALILAIWSDHRDTPGSLEKARTVLEGLKGSAEIEQDTGFDPSGSSGQPGSGRNGRPRDSESIEDWTSQTTATEVTSLSCDVPIPSLGGSSDSGSEDSSPGGYFKRTEQFDTSTKELMLAESFPSLRIERIAFTLNKCDGNFERATDELLNYVYFEESATSPTEVVKAKGVDAFAEDYHVPQRKRGKGKKKKKNKEELNSGQRPSPISEVDLQPLATNKWHDGNRDVEFIATRTKTFTATVASLYHANGASLAGTITAMVEKDIADQKGTEMDAKVVGKAIDIMDKYPGVSFDHAAAMIRITAPSLTSAHELAKALNVPPKTSGRLDVIPRYVPVQLPKPEPETMPLPSLPPLALPYTTQTLNAAQGKAFTQASAAYRKGKSDPLYRGAAAYYSQIGRDANANLKALSEIDADALVDSQSSTTYVDLHGVSVQSATRIASIRVKNWWDGLGEQRIPGGGRQGAGTGYRVITGIGRHSEGGRGKIGPAVAKKLVQEGWKVEINGGEVLVLGRARRK